MQRRERCHVSTGMQMHLKLNSWVKGAINYRLCLCQFELSFHHLHWVLNNIIFTCLLLLCFCLWKRTLSRWPLPRKVWPHSIHLSCLECLHALSLHSHNSYPLPPLIPYPLLHKLSPSTFDIKWVSPLYQTPITERHFFKKKLINIFIFGSVGSSFSVRVLYLVVASGGHSSSRCMGLSLSWPLLLRSTGSRPAGSVVVAHGPSCSAACGTFPDQGSNPCPLHWQADSPPLHHQGSPRHIFKNSFNHRVWIEHSAFCWTLPHKCVHTAKCSSSIILMAM